MLEGAFLFACGVSAGSDSRSKRVQSETSYLVVRNVKCILLNAVSSISCVNTHGTYSNNYLLLCVYRSQGPMWDIPSTKTKHFSCGVRLMNVLITTRPMC